MNKKINNGDIFVIQILNGSYVIGQILDFQMKNIVRIALFNNLIIDLNQLNIDSYCKYDDTISLLTSTIDKFNNDSWKIIGNKSIEIPVNLYPNEAFRNKGWIGSKTYGSAIVEKFLNSYYSLLPWDDMADPYYLDKLLFNGSTKPNNLIYLKS
jgi:hypothetical protein